MRSWCWAIGRLLFETILFETNLVYVVSGLGLLVQDGALFIEKRPCHAKRCPFASMSVFERHLLSE